MRRALCIGLLVTVAAAATASRSATAEQDWHIPYDKHCTERENVFEFTRKPSIKLVKKDTYEITFAVKGYCDVAVAIMDPTKDPSGLGRGSVVRHLAAGVLGKNAPPPFQKNSLEQKLYWNGKDDLDFYVKEPEKLKLRVMLGFKPQFHRRLGGTSGNNLAGYVWGIAIDQDGSYVFTQGSASHHHLTVRKFDHDGTYVQSLTPAPANLPESKLQGLGYVEYEPGKKAIHGPWLRESVTRDGRVWIKFVGTSKMAACQPALANGQLFISQDMSGKKDGKPVPALLVGIHTDGSTDVKGVMGRPFAVGEFNRPFFTASPDGKTIYMSGVAAPQKGIHRPVVLRRPLDAEGIATPFVGDPKKPGTDNTHLANPRGIDCDAKGRVYIADKGNNRIQVFSPDGKHVKTIRIDRPEFLCVHKKTGAIYVLHGGRVKGKTIGRVTKLTSLEQPKEEYHADNLWATAFALDSWSQKPRLWLGGHQAAYGLQTVSGEGPSVRIFEERGKTLEKILDFDEVAKKEAGASYFGRFRGVASDGRGTNSPKSTCDPVNEKLYYRNSLIFDLKTGAYEGQFDVIERYFDDIQFDKRGYMHGHSWASSIHGGRVWRVDPSRAKKVGDDIGIPDALGPVYAFPEVPYDYGVTMKATSGNWTGAIPTKCQGASHHFQDGLGVNMRGVIAVSSMIYYAPKMGSEVREEAFDGYLTRAKERGFGGGAGEGLYKRFLRNIQDTLKKGEIYFIRRQPGIPLYKGTVWTYDANGESRYDTYSAVLGTRMGGIQIDEGGYLYFVIKPQRLVNGKPFLEGRGGNFGAPPHWDNKNPDMGTFIKSKPFGVRVIMKRAVVPVTPLPDRPPDMQVGRDGLRWVEGAEWFYAGACPIRKGGCECPQGRSYLDGYKRSHIQETYRHSIGVVDTNGNLIQHVGTYGNFDSALGEKSQIPVGGDNIAMFNARYIGGTDNFICFDDWGERLMVLRIDYHATETVPITTN